jgi:hypothetical protein
LLDRLAPRLIPGRPLGPGHPPCGIPIESNVESTFSMIKAKFDDSVRSKTDTAMVNEAMCKVLRHNACCLIQSACELGVEATFWNDPEELTHPDSKFSAIFEMDAYSWI